MSKKIIRIDLEDLGQDLLTIFTDENGIILETEPFHSELYKGGYIPLTSIQIGEQCMIHHPPNINYGFLKYKITNIS